ncbi:MAG: M24 family metallopeptidase [Alphaproteobacteria bacterium]
MNLDIIERYRAVMDRLGLAAIIAGSPENFAHVAGFQLPSQILMRWRHAMVIVPRQGDPELVIVDMEQTTVRKRLTNAKLHVWREFSDSAMKVLAAALSNLGYAQDKIGLELDYLPASDYEALQTALPHARFIAVHGELARVRQIKSPREIEVLRRLSRLADRAITEAFRSVRAGMSEMDIAAAVTHNVLAGGGEDYRLLIVATGERSVLPNVGPSERILKRGDVCRVEVFPKIQGYYAGICRTAVVQQAPPHAERIWANLTECKYLLLERMKPGISCRAIYDLFLAKLREIDLPPISFVGHGIGLHLHEDPYLGTHPMIGSDADALLEAGMVLGIEPLVYETGYGFGMQNKDLVLVTEKGCELLSDYCNTDRLIVVE